MAQTDSKREPSGSELPATFHLELTHPPLLDYYGEYDENGVDLSLIRYMLRRTPLERLALMEQHARDTQILFEYGRRHRETTTGPDR